MGGGDKNKSSQHTFSYLLYDGGELQAELDDIVSGYGIVCHCSKRRPGGVTGGGLKMLLQRRGTEQ